MAEGDTVEGLQVGETVPWAEGPAERRILPEGNDFDELEYDDQPEPLSAGEAAAISDTQNTDHIVVATPPQSEVEAFTCEAAFLVYLDPTGHWIADSSKVNVPLIMNRPANANDFRHAVSDMDQDILATAAAGRTIMAQQEMMQQVMKQQEAQRIAAAAGFGGGTTVEQLAAKMQARR